MKKIYWIIGIAITIAAVIILLWLMKKKTEESVIKTPEEIPPDLIGINQNYIEMFPINSNKQIPFKFWNNIHFQISNASISLSFETPEQSLQKLLDQGVINNIQFDNGLAQAHIIWDSSADIQNIGTVNELSIRWDGSDMVWSIKNQKGGTFGARFQPQHWQANAYDQDPPLSYLNNLLETGAINELQHNNGLIQLESLNYRQ